MAVDEDQTITIDLSNNSIQPLENDQLAFLDYFVKYMDIHLFTLFTKNEDAKTADAIVELFRKRENLDLFNKKGIYIYIREITNQSTPQITKVIKKMKKTYVKLMSQYIDSGYVSMRL